MLPTGPLPLESWTLTVPIPPSVNHMFVVARKKVFRSRNYTAWVRRCFCLAKGRQPQQFSQPVSVVITIHGGKGWRRNRDIDNTIKAVVDLIKHLGVIADDSTLHVWETTARYRPPASKKDEAKAVIEVRPVTLCEWFD